MNIEVIKFGGSSLADNTKLMQAAQKTILFLKQGKKVVVILSAQGKTTDNLIKEAKELTVNPNKRELDVLVSVGEQISCAKFAILLNSLGFKTVSLTGWQAGVYTDSDFTEAKIQNINTDRIINELQKNSVVVITGFQGIDRNNNITTLGRNGSDTSALAIAAALNQKQCYIFTDTNGVYSKDPKTYSDAKIIKKITYDEMEKMCKKGAKVLHDRSVILARKYNIKIIVKSTFNNDEGTIVE